MTVDDRDLEQSTAEPDSIDAASDTQTREFADGVTVELPADASSTETAAIMAAVGAHLRDRVAAAAAAAEDEEDSWQGEKWTFAGRLASVRDRPGRVPSSAPTDPWTASGRADRF
jgi:hypothetical protein